MSVMRIAEDGHVVPELLASALTVRESLGRINDLIHACGILLGMPHILGDEERITVRPSSAPATTRAARTTWRQSSASRS